MISMIMILNQKGDIMISRQYRDDVSRAGADSFRLQVRKNKNRLDSTPSTLYLLKSLFFAFAFCVIMNLYTSHKNDLTIIICVYFVKKIILLNQII
jgi:hypothetical protein